MEKIHPCLWFDTQAEEAAQFYTSLFEKSKIKEISRYGESASSESGQPSGTVMVAEFELAGQNFMGLNGGPMFKFAPGVSLFVQCKNEKEIDALWAELSQGGTQLFELKKYPWAEKYGWCTDKFGLPWQLIIADGKTKIAPCLLFTQKLFGQGQEAIQFYTSVFKNSKVESMHLDPETGTVMHGAFSLDGVDFVLMEGKGDHKKAEINHSISFMIDCKDQKELDYYWDTLSAGGATEPCGWLKDKYGVSWQVIPEIFGEMMRKADAVTAERIMGTLMKMSRIDIAALEKARDQK